MTTKGLTTNSKCGVPGATGLQNMHAVSVPPVQVCEAHSARLRVPDLQQGPWTPWFWAALLACCILSGCQKSVLSNQLLNQ